MALSGVDAVAQSKSKKTLANAVPALKGTVRHSLSKWRFGKILRDAFCVICKDMGIE